VARSNYKQHAVGFRCDSQRSSHRLRTLATSSYTAFKILTRLSFISTENQFRANFRRLGYDISTPGGALRVPASLGNSSTASNRRVERRHGNATDLQSRSFRRVRVRRNVMVPAAVDPVPLHKLVGRWIGPEVIRRLHPRVFKSARAHCRTFTSRTSVTNNSFTRRQVPVIRASRAMPCREGRFLSRHTEGLRLIRIHAGFLMQSPKCINDANRRICWQPT
jgi:hypothetical protein